MFRPRVIPVLLISGRGVVKTRKYKNPTYIGDPINSVRIFNKLHADEIIVFDINATKKNKDIDYDQLKEIAKEANMPLAIGGGVTCKEDIKQLLRIGADKVVIGAAALSNKKLLQEAVSEFGSSTIVVSIDIRSNLFGKMKVVSHSATRNHKINVFDFCRELEKIGVGELIINCVNSDGMMHGYNIELVKSIAKQVSMPVVACCGAGSFKDIEEVCQHGYASAAAAGSIFVFHGPRKAVLINYPKQEELTKLFIQENVKNL